MATIDTYRNAFRAHRSTAAKNGFTRQQWNDALKAAWNDVTDFGERFCDGGSDLEKARAWADAADVAAERLAG